MTPSSEALWFLENLMEIHYGASSRGGNALLECTAPAGSMPPLHLHEHEDEGFYVLDGSLELWAGESYAELGIGDGLQAPAGVPHTYRAGPGGARFLVVAGPGFEAFVRAVGVPAAQRRLPDPVAPDAERLGALAAANAIRLLGPPGALPQPAATRP